jgi:hypothetical protein
MHEHVLAAIVGLNEAESFSAVEPRHGPLRHKHFPSDVCEQAARTQLLKSEILVELSSLRACAGEAKPFGRKLDVRQLSLGRLGCERIRRRTRQSAHCIPCVEAVNTTRLRQERSKSNVIYMTLQRTHRAGGQLSRLIASPAARVASPNSQ